MNGITKGNIPKETTPNETRTDIIRDRALLRQRQYLRNCNDYDVDAD